MPCFLYAKKQHVRVTRKMEGHMDFLITFLQHSLKYLTTLQEKLLHVFKTNTFQNILCFIARGRVSNATYLVPKTMLACSVLFT